MNIGKIAKSVSSCVISLSLITLSPGLGFYVALGQMTGTSMSAPSPAQVVVTPSIANIPAGNGTPISGIDFNGVPGAGIRSLGKMTGFGTDGLKTVPSRTISRNNLGQPLSVVSAPAVERQQSAVDQPQRTGGGVGQALARRSVGGSLVSLARVVLGQKEKGAGRRTSVLSRLKIPVPGFASLSGAGLKTAARTDFFSRIGQIGSRSGRSSLRASVLTATALRSWQGRPAGSVGLAAQGKSGRTPRNKRKTSPNRSAKDALGNGEDDARTRLGNDRPDTGPDGNSDPLLGGGGDGGGSVLFSALSFSAAGTVLASVGRSAGRAAGLNPVLMGALFFAGIVLPTIIMHERAHAKKAIKILDSIGGPTKDLTKRLSFNPLVHIHPIYTVALPLFLIIVGSPFVFGMAKPVDVSNIEEYSWHPVRDMAKTALAGPVENLKLALIGAVSFRLLAYFLPQAVVIAPFVGAFVMLNVALALFNLIPVPPLDGSWILRLVSGGERFVDGMSRFSFLPLILAVWVLGPWVFRAAMLAGYFLLQAPIPFIGASAASVFLPVALLAGSLAGAGGGLDRVGPPNAFDAGEGIPAVGQSSDEPVDYIVEVPEEKGRLTQDIFLTTINMSRRSGVRLYRRGHERILDELSQAGITRDFLSQHNADPLASYKRINTATIRVDSEKAAEFRDELERLGFRVDDNEVIEIPEPMPFEPGSPEVDKDAVTLDELVQITNMNPVHKALEEKYGPWNATGWLARVVFWILARLGAENPHVPVAVIDTGAEMSHPHLKGVVKRVVNITKGENKDDVGHGTHVSDTVRAEDPWQRDITVYKAFEGGRATTDDILKALSQAANDGNIVLHNSWGSSYGDPQSPSSRLAISIAMEGVIEVYSAGNSGRKNSIGAPAIVRYLSPETGGTRVIAVAAADREKQTAYFSSRGPGSWAYKDPPYVKPDMTAMGVNLQAAWPSYLKGDVDDPKHGNLKAISGTSMSAPEVTGAISSFARLYGVAIVGKILDKIATGVVENAASQGKPDYEQGKGFLDGGATLDALIGTGLSPFEGVRFAKLRKLVIAILQRFESRSVRRLENRSAREGNQGEAWITKSYKRILWNFPGVGFLAGLAGLFGFIYLSGQASGYLVPLARVMGAVVFVLGPVIGVFWGISIGRGTAWTVIKESEGRLKEIPGVVGFGVSQSPGVADVILVEFEDIEALQAGASLLPRFINGFQVIPKIR